MQGKPAGSSPLNLKRRISKKDGRCREEERQRKTRALSGQSGVLTSTDGSALTSPEGRKIVGLPSVEVYTK